MISSERYVHLSIHLTTPHYTLHHHHVQLNSTPVLARALADIQIMQLVDQAGRQGLRWTAAIRALEQQSSIPIDHSEFTEVVKGLTDEGVVRIVGERERRTIRRLAD